MDLLQNYFYILTATPRDNRQRIMALADERSLLLDSSLCIRARSDLTNPSKRLSAEIAWLPGIGPKRVAELILLLESSPWDILDVDKMSSIARANLLAAGLSRLSDCHSEGILEWIEHIATAFDDIDPKELCVIINNERIVSGFPEVTDLAAIETEIQERRQYYLQTIKLVLNDLSEKERAKTLTAAVERSTQNGKIHGPIIIHDLIDSYVVDVQTFLERDEENIKALVENILAAANEGSLDLTLAPMINQLIQVVKNWHIVAQPIQISTKSRGLDHNASNRVAFLVRGLAIDLFNEHDKLSFAQQLTYMLQEVFAEVVNIAELMAEDAKKLDEIAEKSKLNELNGRDVNDRLDPIWTLCRQALENADKNPDLSGREAQRVIDAAHRLIALACSDGKMPNEFEIQCRDHIALAIFHCAITYGNKTEKWRSCIYFLNEALKYASSIDIRKKIETNLSIVQRNEKLYGGLTPISSAPSLRTINGMGFKLYGSTDTDPETLSYLSTYYFVLFFIPIFPICRYRVIESENGYRFLGKAPLRVFDKWHLAIVSLALLAFVVLNVNLGSNSETAGLPNPQTESSQYSAPSAPETNVNQSEQSVSGRGETQDGRGKGHDSLGRSSAIPLVPTNKSNKDYIEVGQYLCSRYHHNTIQNLKPDETERQDIEANKAILETENNNIKSLKAEIDNYTVDRYSQYSINNYNDLVNEYNSLIKAHKNNISNQNKRIANYNVNIDKYNNYLRQNCREK